MSTAVLLPTVLINGKSIGELVYYCISEYRIYIVQSIGLLKRIVLQFRCFLLYLNVVCVLLLHDFTPYSVGQPLQCLSLVLLYVEKSQTELVLDTMDRAHHKIASSHVVAFLHSFSLFETTTVGAFYPKAIKNMLLNVARILTVSGLAHAGLCSTIVVCKTVIFLPFLTKLFTVANC